jgi:hypothetical protein
VAGERAAPDADAFARRFAQVAVPADESIRLDLLAGQLRLEIAYALQCRHDERATKTPPMVVMQAVRRLADSSAASLLELTEEQWKEQIGRTASNARAPGPLRPTQGRGFGLPAVGVEQITRATPGVCAVSGSPVTRPCGSAASRSR